MSEKKQQRHFDAARKVAIVRRHLVDRVPVADLCDEHSLQPTQFYQWQKLLFENVEVAFDRKGKSGAKTADERQIVDTFGGRNQRPITTRGRKSCFISHHFAKLASAL